MFGLGSGCLLYCYNTCNQFDCNNIRQIECKIEVMYNNCTTYVEDRGNYAVICTVMGRLQLIYNVTALCF